MSESSLIFAKQLNGKGGAIAHTDIQKVRNIEQALWLHFDANMQEAQETVRKAVPSIDEYTLLALFDEEARPRTLQLDNGVLIILRGINHNEGADAEDMVAVRLWITSNRIVSVRYRQSRAVMQVSESLDKNKGPLTIGDTFAQICATMFDFIENTISKLHDQIDQLEERVVDEPDRQLRQDIAVVRKTAILLRRYIAPQKEAMSQLRYAEVPWLSARNLRRTQEAQDSLLRNIEDLDAIRERAQVVKDELMNSLSDKLNRNLYVLSVVTAIFLPLGFLTGLFGINIGGMPGVEKDSAFMIFSMVLFFLVLTQLLFFRVFRWF